jgi:UDP-sulfoquinovose synthase
LLSDSLLDSLMNIAIQYRDRVDTATMLPQVNWRNATNERKVATTGTAPLAAIAR